jgi:hypothetical protein
MSRSQPSLIRTTDVSDPTSSPLVQHLLRSLPVNRVCCCGLLSLPRPQPASLVYNEISGRFTFRGSRFFRGVEEVPSHRINGPTILPFSAATSESRDHRFAVPACLERCWRHERLRREWRFPRKKQTCTYRENAYLLGRLARSEVLPMIDRIPH